MVLLAVVWGLAVLLPSATPSEVSGRSFQFVYHKPLTTLPASVLDRTASVSGRARTGVSGLVEAAGASPESGGSIGSGFNPGAGLLTLPTALLAAERGALMRWPIRTAPGIRCDVRTAGRGPPLS